MSKPKPVSSAELIAVIAEDHGCFQGEGRRVRISAMTRLKVAVKESTG